MHRDAARISSCISRTLLQLSIRSRGIMSNTRTMAHHEPAAYRNEADSLEQIERRLSSYRAERTAPVSDRHAAVFVALFEDEDDVVRVWLTERSRRLSTHPGEICLPGGKKEAGETDIEAALREANEELGVSPRSVRVLATLPSFLSKHKLSVTPIIGTVTPSFRPQPNEEVEAAFSAPLAAFLQQRLHKSRDVTWGDLSYRLHYFHWQGWTVWGLTAAILIQAAQHALGRAPEFAEHNPLGVDYTQLYWDGERVRLQPGADLATHSPGPRMPSVLPSPVDHLPADPSASGPSRPAAAPPSRSERADAGPPADPAHPPSAQQTSAWRVQSAALTGEAERDEEEEA